MYVNGQRSLFLRTVEFTGAGDGFSYGAAGLASDRSYGDDPTRFSYVRGFRPVLYVKL